LSNLAADVSVAGNVGSDYSGLPAKKGILMN